MVRRPIKHAPIRRLHVRKGDVVQILTGNEKGKQGEVIALDLKRGRVTVKGVNLRWKHEKKSPKYPQGGRFQREAPLHLSNVLPVDPKAGKGVRIRHKVVGGKKVRVSAKTGEVLGGA